MKPEQLLIRFARGEFKNVSLRDFQRFLEHYSFRLARVTGSHHIYTRSDLREIVNLQDVNGEAKPSQIRQVIKLIEWHH